MKILSFFSTAVLIITILLAIVLLFWLYFLPAPIRSKIIRPIVRLWCDFLFLKLLAIRLHCKIDHKKIKHPVLILSNHQSFADIAILMKLYQCGFILKNTLMYTPFGFIAAFVGSVPLKRASMKNFLQVAKKCKKRIRQNVSLCFFPEGTRSKTGELLPFKRGLFDVFYKNNIDTLLLVQYGTADVIPRKSWLPQLGKKVVVWECGLLSPNDYTDSKEFVGACRQKMKQGLLEAKKIHKENAI
jgi:1-acyl-sn-glycerol-3-phosphate acyltransferase